MKEIVKNIIKKHGWYIVGLSISLTIFDVIINKEFRISDLLIRIIIIAVLYAVEEIIGYKSKKNK